MAFDTTVADAVLKYDYQGPVREQLNSATVLLKRLKRNTEDFIGKQAYLPVHVGRNVGIGARRESHALPTAGYQQYDKALYNVTHQYGVIKLTGPVLAASKNNSGAFLKALDSEMQGLVRDLKTDVNRQLWHDGSCILTQTNVTGASTSVEVNSTKFLQPGMAIDIRNGSDGAEVAAGRTVSSITDDDTFVISGAAVTTDVNDVVIRDGVRGLSGDGFSAWGETMEMWGLEAIVSDADPGNGLTATVGNIARASYAWWKANVIANGGTARALTLDLMQQAFDESEIEGDTDPGLIVTNHAIKRRYAALLISDKRYPPGGEITLDGGYSALEFNGVPLVADKDASQTLEPGFLKAMYFLAMGSLEFEVLEDWQWMQRDGAILHRVEGYDQYTATMFAYIQLATNRPNANTKLADILES